MRINHNIAALNTYNKLSANQSATSKSLEKLSSGLKINKAGDNAAGLAISEKMRGQINGLNTASTNASDGISLINTAEGALSETHSILQRMRELAVQSSSDTNATNDRAEIQKEVDQLAKEVTRIGNQTEFNTKKLLNGGAGLTTEFTSETVNGTTQDWISVVGGTAETQGSGTIHISGAVSATAATHIVDAVAAGSGQVHTLTINGTDIKYTTGTIDSGNAQAAAAAINSAADKTGVTAKSSGASLIVSTKDVGLSSKLVFASDANSVNAAAITAASGTDNGSNATITSTSLGATSFIATGNTITVADGIYQGLEFKIGSNTDTTTSGNNLADFKITGNGSLTLHIGANEGQTMGVSIGDMRAEALGINALDVTTQAGAESAITTVDNAIINVSSERAKLGAYTNRLEHTINNLSTSSENTASSESRIRDVDMAKEMTEFTKNNILSQAAQSMLAQANQQPQKVLSLLQ
ncbi:flagellin [Acetobacterium fimetarium]|uniref:Flagellin n=1 Tax=Acetobacterium fimetarium TaxID=52691 RepID=A0ABR6WWQ4_9FIRM|nr:flagellin [Acetobacterium fimetarium]MBC3805017.1 flagellin [Acetobacterium fimetarium]